MMEEKKGEEKQSVPQWKRKWIASRMTFESILFERELLTPKKEKSYKGIIYFILIFIFQIGLLFFYFFRNNGALSYIDIEKIKMAENYFSSIINSGFMEFLKSGNMSTAWDMPFYYLTYIPIFKYITSDYSYSIFIVNSIYILLIMISIYLIINIKRNYQSALLGVAFASSMPYLINLSHHFSPQLATIAFVCLTYFFFIKSEEFEDNKWIFPMALSVSFGILTDKFFLFYVLPIVPWFVYVFGGIYRASLFKGFLPGIIFGIPFYLRLFVQLIIVSMTYGRDFIKNKNFNLFWYINPSINALHVIFFIIGIITLLWMYYSLFMPYERRKIVGKWFFLSYIAFWILPIKRPEYIYPALIPFAISTAIMTPSMIRKFLLYFFLGISFINQTGIITEKYINFNGNKINIIGLPEIPSKKEKLDNIMILLKENISGVKIVGIYGENNYINANTLKAMSLKYKINDVKFINCPEEFSFLPDILIVKGADNIQRLPKEFFLLFKEKINFNNRDISIFIKDIPEQYIIKEIKKYPIKNMSFAGINFADIFIDGLGFDEVRKVYKDASIYISYATHDEIDAYGINLKANDFCIARIEDKFIICGFSGLKIENLKITDFSLARYIEKKFPMLKNFSVEIDRYIEISGDLNGRNLLMRGNININKSDIVFSFNMFSYNGYELPDWLYHFLNFKIDFKELPVSIKINNIKYKKALLEII